MADETIAAQMARLYARIPAVRCQRRCQQSCSASVFQMRAMTTFEFNRSTLGIPPRPRPIDEPCQFLAGGVESGRCVIYAQRPLICRLFGVVDHPQMRCPFGCEPDRWLTDEEARAMLAEADRIGGGRA